MENVGLANVFHELMGFPKNFLKPARNLGNSMNSWKTLAWPMFSIVFSWKFMENIGLANVFHELMVFQRISETSQESRKFYEFMENIGLANVFHCFFMEIHGKHWPGQCFP